MKKLILALAECCAFFSQGISMNSDAKLNSIERLEKKINVLKAERENIKHKLSSIQDELSVVEKKKETFKGKIKKPNLYNPEVFACQYFKTMLEKIENDVKKLRLLVAQYKSLLDSDKIDLSIDKAKIELIKAEIKAGKTPKVPLEVAKALIETTKSSVKLSEINIKTIEEKFKEKEAYIKYLEKSIEATERQESIRKNTNDSYTHIYFTNIEDAESRIEKAILRLKYRQAQRKKLYLETKRAEAIVKWLKAEHKLRNIYLRFNKVLDEENFVSF